MFRIRSFLPVSTRARAHRKCLTKEYYGRKKVTLQEKGKHVFTVKATDIVHGDAPRTVGRFLPPGTYPQHMFPISRDALCVPGKKVRGKVVIQPGRKRQVAPGVIPDASPRFLHGARWLTWPEHHENSKARGIESSELGR